MTKRRRTEAPELPSGGSTASVLASIESPEPQNMNDVIEARAHGIADLMVKNARFEIEAIFQDLFKAKTSLKHVQSGPLVLR